MAMKTAHGRALNFYLIFIPLNHLVRRILDFGFIVSLRSILIYVYMSLFESKISTSQVKGIDPWLVLLYCTTLFTFEH
jgi:hypothetical protein